MRTLAPLLVLIMMNCSPRSEPPTDGNLSAALGSLSGERLLDHIRVLASDEFEGRLPGTKGEELTVQYLTEQFEALGLTPGNPNGTWVQDVPLAGYNSKPSAEITAGGRVLPLKWQDDYVAVSRRLVPEVSVRDSDVVFVGHGVVAPEFGWDDYKGLDVKGKTIVMLINDPAVPDPNDPSKLDDAMFRGRAMTYYGRWTYKYEIAAERGAAAAIIVHEDGPAGYPWAVVRAGWSGKAYDLQAPDRNMRRAAVESWITAGKARELMQACGQDFDALKKAAVRKSFQPVPLAAKASFRITNELSETESKNVIAKLEGSDPKLKDEYIIYTAHWDHLGKDESLEGDQIYNGALDNASGTGSLVELARAFQIARPKRSILFMAVTAEEQGLLGAKHYAENPLYPLERTVANINVDGLNQWGRTADIEVVGYGNSTLDEVAEQVAAETGREIRPDTSPEKGFFYRADHFEFAKQGVPAFYTHAGTEYIGRPKGWGEEKRKQFIEQDYHKPSDEIKPDWDVAGMEEDARFMFRVGYRVAQAESWPEWKPGTEFKARREEMLRQAASR